MIDLLTTDEVAEILKMSRYTVCEMFKVAGIIKAHRINGRTIRVMRSDLHEYIISCEIRENEEG